MMHSLSIPEIPQRAINPTRGNLNTQTLKRPLMQKSPLDANIPKKKRADPVNHQVDRPQYASTTSASRTPSSAPNKTDNREV